MPSMVTICLIIEIQILYFFHVFNFVSETLIVLILYHMSSYLLYDFENPFGLRVLAIEIELVLEHQSELGLRPRQIVVPRVPKTINMLSKLSRKEEKQPKHT